MKKARIGLSLMLALCMLLVQACSDENDPIGEISDGLDDIASTTDLSLASNAVAYQWTDLLLELERYSAGRPNASARSMAYIYLAAYETIAPGSDTYRSLDGAFRNLRIRDDERAAEIDYQIALNAAFATVVEHFLLNVPIERTTEIETLQSEIDLRLQGTYTSQIISDSQAWGEYVAGQVIAYSQTDDDAEEQILDPQPTDYEPPVGEGFWTYSAEEERALYPYWGETVRSFVIRPRQTSAVEPIPYSEDPNSDYFAQMQEVVTANDAAREEDGEQLWIAEFWSDDVEGLMMSPPARQVAIANQLIEQYELNLEASLALMVKLGFALNDAAVAAWKYKYDFMVMRPNVYIHEFIDPDFQTNLFRLVFWPNPSFPSYPSGHSTFASAAGGVFIDAFGDATNFTDRTHEGRTEFRGEPRTFSTFSDMAAENAYSRIPLGVHMRMDCDEGLRLGYEIADAINSIDLTAINQ